MFLGKSTISNPFKWIRDSKWLTNSDCGLEVGLLTLCVYLHHIQGTTTIGMEMCSPNRLARLCLFANKPEPVSRMFFMLQTFRHTIHFPTSDA